MSRNKAKPIRRRAVLGRTNGIQNHHAIWRTCKIINLASITYLAKLPNDLQSHKNFMEIKDVLYGEITNQFPDYSFSQFERYKHWIRMDGSKIR